MENLEREGEVKYTNTNGGNENLFAPFSLSGFGTLVALEKSVRSNSSRILNNIFGVHSKYIISVFARHFKRNSRW